MIDTVRVRWSLEGQESPSGLQSIVASAGASDLAYTERYYYQGQARPWFGVSGSVPNLGRVFASWCEDREVGETCRVDVEVSLPKLATGENGNLLSRSDVEDMYRIWRARCESSLPVQSLPEVRRVDIAHQREVGDSAAVLAGLKPILGGASVYGSGFAIKHSSRWLSRMYDKGVESRRADLLNWLRQEEQVRSGGKVQVGELLDRESGIIDVSAACALMNSKWGGDIILKDLEDVKDLMKEKRGAVVGAAVLGLYHNPELWAAFKASASYRTVKKYEELVSSVTLGELGMDLRVTEEELAG